MVANGAPEMLTKRTVEGLGQGGWAWDDRVVGFGVRRQRKGCFYLLRYRVGGKQQYATIGRHGSPWTPDTARTEAKRLLGLVAAGTSPKADTAAGDFGAEVDRYLERKQAEMKPRTLVEVERHLRQQAKPLHRLTDIDRRAVATCLAQVEAKSGPVARNSVRSSLSAFFNWAIREGLRETNPVTGTGTAPQASRERVLTDAELAAIWNAATSDQFGDIVRLLILTGQRREEIGSLRWSEITNGAFVLPPKRTKNGRTHTVPLSAAAAEIIDRQVRRPGRDLIFGNGVGGFSGWGFSKARLDARLAIAPWRLHDLRRTAATGMAELGVLPHIIEAILNHVSGHRAGVAGIYNRARYEGEMREALNRWARHVAR
jgi:integrase